MKKTLLHLCAFATLTVGFVSFVGCTGETPKKAEPATTQPAATDTAHQHAPGDTTHTH